MKTKFFMCATCGNVVVKMIDSGMDLVCCSQQMKELVPCTTDVAKEKHLPVVEINEEDCTIKVTVGSEPHPMESGHHIVFIYLETENGGQIQYLNGCDKAEAVFCGCTDKPVAVYEYCNIHGLWKTTDFKVKKHHGHCCHSKRNSCR